MLLLLMIFLLLDQGAGLGFRIIIICGGSRSEKREASKHGQAGLGEGGGTVSR